MKKLMQAKVICPVLLVLVMAGHVAADFAWQRENVAPYWWDQASYLILSEHMRLAFEQGGVSGFWDAFLTLDPIRAPLASAMYAATYAVAGDSRESAHIVNYLSIVMLCLFLYGIGKRLAGPWCGLAAAHVTMAAPMMFSLSRQLLVEFPLAAAAAAVAYLCIVSNGLRRCGICVLLGAAIGIGMLIKIIFPAFIVGPLLVAIAARVFHHEKEEADFLVGGLLLNLVIVLVVAAAVCGPWYLHNWEDWTKYMKENVGGHLGTIYGGSNNSYLAMLAQQNLLYIYVFIFAVLAALRLVFRRGPSVGAAREASSRAERRVALLITLAWLFIPIGIGLYSLNKDPRLIAPACAALGVLLAYLFIRVTARRTGFVTAGLLLLIVIPFYGVSFGTPFDSTKYSDEVELPSVKDYLLGRWSTGFATSPVKEDWKDREVISFTRKQMPKEFIKDNRVATVVVLGCHPWFQATWLSYLQWHENAAAGRTATLIEYSGMPVLGEDASLDKFAQEVLKAHLVIFKDSGWQGWGYGTRWFDELTYAVRETKETHEGREIRLFEKIDCDITLPDGSKVVVYRQQGMMFRATAEQRDEFWTLRAKFIEMARSYRKP
jgi:4-amino-4-deoxy-L-arabinose transferase-like glycosyltransferase